MSVSEIAEPYDLTLAAVLKHLIILEKAKLVIKHRRGKEQLVNLVPVALKDASENFEKIDFLDENRFFPNESLQ